MHLPFWVGAAAVAARRGRAAQRRVASSRHIDAEPGHGSRAVHDARWRRRPSRSATPERRDGDAPPRLGAVLAHHHAPPATSRRCGRAARCPASSRPTTTGTYVLKFRGAGQGVKVLVAEILVGEIARLLGIRVPDGSPSSTWTPQIAQVRGRRGGPGPAHREHRAQPRRRLPARLVRVRRVAATRRRRTSPRASSGWTRSPPTSTAPGATPTCCSGTAGPWAIDHGAALYFHHGWPSRGRRPRRGSPPSPSTPRPTCCGTWRPTRPRRTPTSRRCRHADVLAAVVAAGPGRVAGAGARARRPRDAVRAAYVEHLLGPARAPGGLAARRWRRMSASATSTSCCGACPASTARSSSTSGWSSTPERRLPRRRLPRRPRPAARPRARARPRGRRGLVAHARRRMRRPVARQGSR